MAEKISGEAMRKRRSREDEIRHLLSDTPFTFGGPHKLTPQNIFNVYLTIDGSDGAFIVFPDVKACKSFLEAYAMGRRWGENRMRERVTRAMGRPEL